MEFLLGILCEIKLDTTHILQIKLLSYCWSYVSSGAFFSMISD